jgi:hypothetical protein
MKKKNINVVPNAKQTSTLEQNKLGFPTTIFAKQHAAQHPITQRWVEKNSNQLCDFLVN